MGVLLADGVEGRAVRLAVLVVPLCATILRGPVIGEVLDRVAERLFFEKPESGVKLEAKRKSTFPKISAKS